MLSRRLGGREDIGPARLDVPVLAACTLSMAQTAETTAHEQLGSGGDSPQLLSTEPVDFARPRPAFFDNTSRASSATLEARASGYGSIAGLNPKGEPEDQGASREKVQDAGVANANNLSQRDELPAPVQRRTRRRVLVGVFAVVGCVIVVLAIVLPVYFVVVRKRDSDSGHVGSTGSGDSGTNTDNGGTNSGNTPPPNTPTWGGDGSLVTKEDGTTFTYNNTFGGYWVYDPANPLNNSAKAQSWTPSLAEQWRYGIDKMYGVNLGGWLNLEPFISPALYEPFYPNAVDEWTLSELIQARDGNLNAIEEHYKTFIVEEDFAMIAAAGLNWIRIPIAFWAVEKYDNEPFLERVSWTYFLKAITWARKYGLRINLDLHAVPGSQNGWNHSGKLGDINFLRGVMGLANAERTLDYIRIITEFISQPEYRDVVPMFGILNEPRSNFGSGYPKEAMQAWYAEAYRIIRTAGGTGAGNGPYVSIHDAFYGMSGWTGYTSTADRLAMDHHPYLVFGEPIDLPPSGFVPLPCSRWAGMFADASNAFGLTTAGEWSHAINDCGLYLNAVGRGTRYEGTFESTTRIGDCAQWDDYSTWSQDTKDALRGMSLSTMDALQNWFFWTWRIGETLQTGKVRAPFWSYKLGLQEGWSPTDPRDSIGQCQRLGQATNTFTGPLQPYQIGGTGQGGVGALDAYPWPPSAIGGGFAAAAVPRYTPTGSLLTMPGVTVTSLGSSATFAVGDGWANDADTTPMRVPVQGCVYPNQWDANNAAVPACGVGIAKRDAPTPAPML